jgi:tetratricopeptide (TPR) repeat protein
LPPDDDLSVIQEPVFLAAIESLKQAHRIDPSDTQIIYNLALTLLRTTQAEAAATKFRLLLSITPDSENAVKGLELCEQMISDQSRIEAMKKRRAEAQKVATPAAVPSSPPKPSPTPSPSKTTSQPSPAPSPTAATSPAVATSPPVAVSAVATGAPKAAAPVSSSEPKSESGVRDLLSQIRETSFYFPHDALKAPGPYPDGINSAHRELYLVDEDFKKLLGVGSKEEFLAFPQWKQVLPHSFPALSFYSPRLILPVPLWHHRSPRRRQLASFRQTQTLSSGRQAGRQTGGKRWRMDLTNDRFGFCCWLDV